jgi:hypothetical protein
MAYSGNAVRTMRTMEAKQCAICERTLLVGELPLRFAPDGMDEYVDVCVLCQEIALDHGWVREGSPIGPAVRHTRRRRPLSLTAIFGAQRRPAAEQIVAEPILRRLSPSEQTQLEAAGLFNASDAVRTVDGISRSLGEPHASIVVLPGSNAEVVITIAWEISWYQYRVSPGSPQPVRLAERGLEPGELDEKFAVWNARYESGQGILPDIENPLPD